MALKFVFLFLSTLLLVQNSLCKPAPSDDSSAEIPGLPLILYVFEGFGSLSDQTVRKGIKLLQDVHDEITASDHKDDETVARLEEYTKLIAKMEEQLKKSDSKDFTDKYNIVIEFGSLLDDVSPNVNSGESAKLFEESLKKHGMDDVTNDFKKGFEKFATGFIEEANKLLHSEENLPNKEKLQEFVTEFEGETVTEDKVTTFNKFFELFDD